MLLGRWKIHRRFQRGPELLIFLSELGVLRQQRCARRTAALRVRNRLQHAGLLLINRLATAAGLLGLLGDRSPTPAEQGGHIADQRPCR